MAPLLFTVSGLDATFLRGFLLMKLTGNISHMIPQTEVFTQKHAEAL